MENAQRISALENPEEATKVASAIFNPVPDAVTIDMPPDGSVELPGGYMDTKGEIHTTAEVRELNGADEEYLAKPAVMKDMGRWLGALLERGTVRIGPYEKVPPHVFGSLLVGDRDMLALAIRKVTYGTKLETTTDCPSCGERLDIEYDLDKDIPIKKLESERVFPFELRDGRQVKVCLPVGSDQEAILSGSNRSLAEISTLVLSRAVLGEDGVPLGTSGVQALGILDRRRLLKEVTERQPGPKYSEVELECAVCARKFPLRIDLLDLFR